MPGLGLEIHARPMIDMAALRPPRHALSLTIALTRTCGHPLVKASPRTPWR